VSTKFEQRAQQERRAGLRLALLLSMGGLGVIVAIVAFIGAASSGSSTYWRVAAAVAALLLLILRQLSRRLNRGGGPKADPQSMLNLHDDSISGPEKRG
jgi:amino acid transporter